MQYDYSTREVFYRGAWMNIDDYDAYRKSEEEAAEYGCRRDQKNERDQQICRVAQVEV